MEKILNLWNKLDGPTKIGVFFGTVAAILAIIGMFRGFVENPTPLSWVLAIVISAGGWGVVSWAIATAAVEVEEDVARRTAEAENE